MWRWMCINKIRKDVISGRRNVENDVYKKLMKAVISCAK
jgi:hypothetical protein